MQDLYHINNSRTRISESGSYIRDPESEFYGFPGLSFICIYTVVFLYWAGRGELT